MASRQLDLWSAGAAAISVSDGQALRVVHEPSPAPASLQVLARVSHEPLDVLGARAQYYVDSARRAYAARLRA